MDEIEAERLTALRKEVDETTDDFCKKMLEEKLRTPEDLAVFSSVLFDQACIYGLAQIFRRMKFEEHQKIQCKKIFVRCLKIAYDTSFDAMWDARKHFDDEYTPLRLIRGEK